MKIANLCLAALVASLSACAAGYTLVSPGAVSVSDFAVDAGDGWNRVPAAELAWARRRSQVWTQNGVSLDRLVLIPHIEDGDSIYRPNSSIEYPLFRAGMTSAELAGLVDETIELAQGANRTEVTTSEIRTQRFGDEEGILFDIEAIVHDGPAYRGIAGAFASDDRLYVVYFLGASPYYYEQQSASALATILSARR